MGADILERLNAKTIPGNWTEFCRSELALRAEAAAEIARLRGEVALAAGWHCTGDEMRCFDGHGCECAMNGNPPPANATLAPAEAKGGECSRQCMDTMSCDNSCKPAGGEAVAWVCSPAENIAQHVGINSEERQKLIDAGFDVSHYRPLVYGDATPPAAQVHLSDEVEEVIVRRAFADIEADVYEDERALTMKRAAELLAPHPAAGDKVRDIGNIADKMLSTLRDLGYDCADKRTFRADLNSALEAALAQPQSGEVSGG